VQEADVTQANLESIFADGNTPILQALIGGTSSLYLKPAGNGTTVLPNIASPATPAAGQIWYDAGVIKYFNGSSVQSLGAGSAGTVTEVTTTAPLGVTTGTSTPALTITQATTSTDGYLSSAHWNIFNSKMSNALPDGQIFVGNGSSVANPVAVNGEATLSNTGALTVTKLKNINLPGPAPATGEVMQYNGTSWAFLNLTAALDGKLSVSSMPANCSAGQTLTFASPTGAWVCSPIQITSAQIVDPTPAANYYVRLDGHDSNCNGTGNISNASPPNCAFASISAALNKLPKEITTPVVITVQSGTYNLTTPISINKDFSSIGSLAINGSGGVTLQPSSPGFTGPLIMVTGMGMGPTGPALNFANFTLLQNGATNAEAMMVMNGYVGLSAFNVNGFESSLNLHGGFIGLTGTNSITGSGMCPTLIRLDSGSFEVGAGSTTLTMNTPAGTNQECRAVRVGNASNFRSSGSLAIVLPGTSGTNRPIGFEVSSGGFLELSGGTVTINPNGNPQSTVMLVRSGQVYVGDSTTFSATNISGMGVAVEAGGQIEHYGSMFSLTSGGGSSALLLKLRDGSRFVAAGNVTLNANSSVAPNRLVTVDSGSIFRFEPYDGASVKTLSLTGPSGGSNKVGFEVSKGSVLDLGATQALTNNPSISANSLTEFATLSAASSLTVKGTTSAPAVTVAVVGDSSSVLLNKLSSPSNFPSVMQAPLSNCPGMTNIAGTGICYKNTAAQFYAARNACITNQMKLCSSQELIDGAPAITAGTGTTGANAYAWISDAVVGNTTQANSAKITTSSGAVTIIDLSANTNTNTAVYYCCPKD
jgi:hypothetical protein